MSLSGSLDVFPMTEVFRLLDRTGRSGQLNVETEGSRGRVFFDGGALTFATNVDDSELRRQLVAAGLLAPDGISDLRVAISSVPPEHLAPFVHEHTIESLFRITKSGHGFVFGLDERAPFESGQRFDTKDVIAEAERRASAWADIEAVVADLEAPMTMRRDLDGRTEVVLTAASWRLLTQLGGGRSIRELARITGSTEFQVASLAADLVRNGLVEIVEVPVPVDTRPTEETTEGWWSDPDPSDAEAGPDELEEATIVEEDPPTEVFEEPEAQEPNDDSNVTSFARGAIRRRLTRDEPVEQAALDDAAV